PTAVLFPPQRRKMFHKSVLREILQERAVSSRNRRNPRGVKRKMSNFPLRPRGIKPLPPINLEKAIKILK
ncbi:MAG TPA: hypothetical protein VII90_06855, partial [Anaerolineales bacterium]